MIWMKVRDRFELPLHWPQAYEELVQYLTSAPANVSRKVVLEQAQVILDKARYVDETYNMKVCPHCSMHDMRFVDGYPWLVTCGSCSWWRDCEARQDYIERFIPGLEFEAYVARKTA